MKPERWQRIKKLLELALEQEPHERAGFLDKACIGDATLRKEVEALIAYDKEADSFLESPVFDAAQLVQDEQAGKSNQTEREGRRAMLDKLVGQVLDEKYRIDKQLGQGGMGSVYLATHLGTGRPVALKVIAPQFMAQEEFVERFKREAKAAGLLRHPNVVNVTDFGFSSVGSDRLAYLVMEYLNGSNLGEMLKKKGRLPLGFVVDIVEQICLAIDEAHKRGIIHRDLKPDNIWLEPNGRGGYNVKVLDFGLAKLRDAAPSGIAARPGDVGEATPALLAAEIDPAALSAITAIKPREIDLDAPTQLQHVATTHIEKTPTDEEKTEVINRGATAGLIDPHTVPEWLTRVGMVLGTPLYMSPEQCHGRALDARSDIYSLGVIVYQMLTAETPFMGDMYQLIAKHTDMPPPPLRERRRDIPKPVAALVMSALAKNPNERPASAAAFATALRANVEGEVPILRQAFDLYRSNSPTFLRISTRVNFPFILLNSLLIFGLLQTSINSPLAQLIQLVWWISPLLLILFAGSLNTAAFALAVEQLRRSPNSRVRAGAISTALKNRLPQLAGAAIRSYLLTALRLLKFIVPGLRAHIDYSFFAPVIMMEEKQGSAALSRSKALADRLRPLAVSVQIRGMLNGLIAFLLFFLTFFIYSLIYDSLKVDDPYKLVTIIVLTLILPGLFLISTHPFIALALSLLYFKTREVSGETLTEALSLDSEDLELLDRLKIKNRFRAAMPIVLVVALIMSSSSYVLLVPPAGPVLHPERPAIEKVPAEENAWTEYDLAIKDLLEWNNISIDEVSSNKTVENLIGSRTVKAFATGDTYSKLSDAAAGFSELTEQQVAFLDSHAGAIAHLLAGVKKPRAQFFTEPLTISSKVPNLLQMRSLSIVATAQARRLELEGKMREAAELDLAVYRMATDMAEPNAPLISDLIAVVCRGNALLALFHWINLGGADPATDIEIARQVAALDSRMPTPYQAMLPEWRIAARNVEDVLIHGQGELDLKEFRWINLVKRFPGLRVRTYNSFMHRYSNYKETLRPGLEKWDFNGLKKSQEEVIASAQRWYWPPSVGNMLASFLFSRSATSLASMKSLYGVQYNGAALQAFAALLAYQKTHGKFPDTLEPAMSEAGLKVPLDVATGKPIGYRLENGKPVVWLAGVDGKDDGGLKPYDSMHRADNIPGNDLIFRFGEMPFWSKK